MAKATDNGHTPEPGPSILEKLRWLLEEELDSLLGDPDVKPSQWCPGEASEDVGNVIEWQEYGELRGRAQGLAMAITMVMNPYAYDDQDENKTEWEKAVKATKADAVTRWKEDLGDDATD